LRVIGFINGQTGATNPNAQGFVHLIKDGLRLPVLWWVA